MSAASDGVLNSPLLRVGTDELNWLQFVTNQWMRRYRLATMTSPGLICGRAPDGGLDQQWRVTDSDDDGSITVEITPEFSAAPAYAGLVDDEGHLAVLTAKQSEIITLPDDGVWRTVTAEAVASQYEEGTLALLAGSATVTGVGTNFLLFTGKSDNSPPVHPGTRIRIAIADTIHGHQGTYEVDQVISATSMILTTIVNGGVNETITNWTVSGNFLGTPPADPDIHQFRRVEIAVQSGIQREPASNLFPLADVMRDSANTPEVTIIDRRTQRMHRSAVPFGGHETAIPAFALPIYGTTTPGTTGWIYTSADVGGTVVANAVCPDTDSHIVSVCERGGNLRTYRDDDGASILPEFYGLQATAGSFAGNRPALARMPPGSGYTHILTYTTSNGLYCKRSTNNTTTWSSGILILDATAIDVADLVVASDVKVLLNGRIEVIYDYYDHGPGHWRIYAAVSEDNGATWDVNGDHGYAVKVIPAADCQFPKFAQAADGRLFCTHLVDLIDVGLTVSADPSGLWSDYDAASNDTLLDKQGFYNTLSGACIWISPEGMPVIFYDAFQTAGGFSHVRYAVIGTQFVGGVPAPYIMADRLVILSGAALLGSNSLAICQDNGGRLVIQWTYASQSYHAYITRLSCFSQPYQEGAANRYRM